MERRAVVVDCLTLKPCWWFKSGKCGCKIECITDACILASWQVVRVGL